MSDEYSECSLNRTPQPSAWSTNTKTHCEDIQSLQMDSMSQVRKKLYDLDCSGESLGLLPLEKITSTNSSISEVDIDNFQQPSRALALQRSKNLLEKLQIERSALYESTVNDSDLLKGRNGRTLTCSTPSNSTVNESDLLGSRYSSVSSKPSLSKDHSVSRYIEDLKAKFRCNTTASFNEILANHSKTSILVPEDGSETSENSFFVPAAECKEQFSKDEKQWRQEYAVIPVETTKSSFASSQVDNLDDKMSIGEFFRGKSNTCSYIFGKNTSECNTPIGLVNSTTVDEDLSMISMQKNQTAADILSLSGIKNLLSDDATPSKVLERLLNPKTRSQECLHNNYYDNNKHFSPNANSSSKYSKQFASSNDLRPTKLISSSLKSLSCLENKENVPQNENERNRTISSMRTSSSMATIPEGSEKISIASTKSELIWGCVREGRSSCQSFTIRNKYHRRVIYNIHANNNNYKLSDSQSSRSTIVLHPLETRELQVAFNPVTIGPQVGQLLFTPVVHKREQVSMQQRISLFGYGGHVSLDIKGQTRDLSGKLWVSLGHVEGKQTMTAEFVVVNHGTIDGFASFSVSHKSLCAYEDVEIEPAQVVVKKGDEKVITVKFHPTKSDLALLASTLSSKTVKTAEIGVIKMISGADINRQRIVKVNKKLQKEYHLQADPLQQQLAIRFHGAKNSKDSKNNGDIDQFNESVASAKMLMQSLDSTEISLLVDRDPDDSLLPEADDTTVIFKTLVYPDGESTLEEPKTDNSFMKYFNFEPLMLILTPPTKCSDIILLTSHYSKRVAYEISILPDDVLLVSNRCGQLNPEETKVVQVSCPSDFSGDGRQDFKIIVDIEYECISSLVSIIPNL